MVSEEISHSFRKLSPALTPALITLSEVVGRNILTFRDLDSLLPWDSSISVRMRVCAVIAPIFFYISRGLFLGDR